MKKIFFLSALVFLFFASSNKALASVWTNPDLFDIAAAKDAARGWNSSVPNSPLYCDPIRKADYGIKDDLKDGKTTTNMEGWSSASQTTLLYNLSSMITGVGETLCKNKITSFYQKSATGTVAGLVGSMYDHPPASFSTYAYDLLHNAGLVKKAYAQGIGFSGLSPIFPLWKTFRNISYLAIMVVLIVIGFMIMFRMKINPQTVISIQNALPNLVVTLILITFSYAIAGLMIDLMYFVMRIIINIIVNSGFRDVAQGSSDISFLEKFYLNANISGLLDATVFEGTIVRLPAAIFSSVWRGWANTLTGANAPSIGAWIANFFAGSTAGILVTIGSGIGTILIALALLLTFVRIFFILLSSYIQIILSVVLAPFQLLFGAIPGRSTFRGWLFGLLANLSVFPTTVFLFLLGGGITSMSLQTHDVQNLWSPPFLGGTSDPGVITALIGLGLTILTPTILNTVKGLFQAKPVLPIGPGVIFQPILGAGQTTGQVGMQAYYLQHAKEMIPKGARDAISKMFTRK